MKKRISVIVIVGSIFVLVCVGLAAWPAIANAAPLLLTTLYPATGACSGNYGTCNLTNALGSNESDYGTFTKNSGTTSEAAAYLYLDHDVSPSGGSLEVKFDKNNQDPWMPWGFLTRVGGTCSTRVTLNTQHNAVTGAVQSYSLSGTDPVCGAFFYTSGNTSAQTINIYYAKFSINEFTATPTGTASPTNTLTPSVTPTGTLTPTATMTVTPAPVGFPSAGGNHLGDGDMEQYPTSDFWYLIDPQGLWGRGNDDNNYFWAEDAAPCGKGYQYIGQFPENELLGLFGLSETVTYGGIEQIFDWEGGAMIVSLWDRGNFSPIGPPARLKITVVSATGVEYVFGDTILTDYVTVQADNWSQLIAGPLTVPAGSYKIRIADYGFHDGFNHKMYVDDVIVVPEAIANNVIVTGGCSTDPQPNSTATPTPAPFYYGDNCDFESGPAQWDLSSESAIINTAPVGPVGDHYLHIEVGNIFEDTNTYSDAFNWEGGTLYVRAYMRSEFLSTGQVAVISNTGTGQGINAIFTPINPNWILYEGQVYLDPGVYRIGLLGTFWGINYDGVIWGGNGYTYCQGGPTLTPTLTPTITRTPTGTLPTSTSTPTRTQTPRVTPSRTPIATWTQKVTPTTFSGYPPTSTGLPTTTSLPTSTQSSANQTATAQGTVIGTFTPYPTGTPYPTYTPYPSVPGDGSCPSCTVGEQPPNQPDNDCSRPTYFWEVARWVDYARCDIITFISWSPVNTQQLQYIDQRFSTYEPWGTMSEIVQAGQAFQGLWQSYNWVATGYQAPTSVARPNIVTLSQAALSGNFSFTADPVFGAAFSLEYEFCRVRMVSLFSTNVGRGMCTAWTLLHLTGVLEWIQFFWDLAAWALFFRYAWKFVNDLMK